MGVMAEAGATGTTVVMTMIDVTIATVDTRPL
jgi:hypothetical protein